MRNLKETKAKKPNTLWDMYHYISPLKLFKQTCVIEVARYIPNVKLKHWLFRNVLHMTLGERSAFAFKVVPDLLYPELITVGENSIVGYNTTILTHEYLVESFRTGPVHIGHHTMIGANVTILPGVTIGDRVGIGAGTIVSKDVPDDTLAYGNPMQFKQR